MPVTETKRDVLQRGCAQGRMLLTVWRDIAMLWQEDLQGLRGREWLRQKAKVRKLRKLRKGIGALHVLLEVFEAMRTALEQGNG